MKCPHCGEEMRLHGKGGIAQESLNARMADYDAEYQRCLKFLCSFMSIILTVMILACGWRIWTRTHQPEEPPPISNLETQHAR